MKDIPPKVLETFERMKESEEGCIELKKIRGRYYVYRATSEWDKEDKKVKKITEYFDLPLPPTSQNLKQTPSHE